MKKISLIICTVFLSLSVFAGNDKVDAIYSKIKGESDAFSISLSKDMIDFFDLDIDVNGKDKLITGDFSKGKMMVLSQSGSGEKAMSLFLKEGYDLIDFEEEYESESGDNDGEVYLLVKRNGKTIKEAHFIVAEDEKLILLSIFGDMQVSDQK